MPNRNAAIGYYDHSELDRLRSAVGDLLEFVDLAAPNNRERQRLTKVLGRVRDLLEETLDATR